jgi:hypothetical protein
MCKTNVETYFYYANICKLEYEKNMTRLWCRIMLKIGVDWTEGNERSYFYLYPFVNLTQGNFQKNYICALSKEVS